MTTAVDAPRIPGHAFRGPRKRLQGAGDWTPADGSGFARCQCGAASETSLPSVKTRMAWHREHRAAVASGDADDLLLRGEPL